MLPHVLAESESSSDYFADLQNDQRWRDLASKTTDEVLPGEKVVGAFAYLKRKWHAGLDSTDSENNSLPDFIDSLKRHPEWNPVVQRTTWPYGDRNVVNAAFQFAQKQASHSGTRPDSTPQELVSLSESDSPQINDTDSSGSPYNPSNCTRAQNANRNADDLQSEHAPLSEAMQEDAEGRELGMSVSNARNRPLTSVDMVQRSDLLLADPVIWGIAVQDIASLKHGQWINHSVLNFYVLLRWTSLRHISQTYFVDMVFTHENASMSVDEHHISLFRKRYQTVRLPSRRVVFICFHSNHYFVSLFDYDFRAAWILGANIARSGCYELPDVQWNEWGGDRMWIYLSTLFGWCDILAQPARVIGIDWKQVCSLNCVIDIMPMFTRRAIEWV